MYVFVLGYKTSGSGPNLESKNHSNQFTLRLTCLFVIFIVTLDRSFLIPASCFDGECT